MSRSRLAAVAIVAAVLAVYVLRLDDVAGLMVDDAWYIVLGKALAQGDGYRLISSATTAILPAVPPGFPALLSTVFLIDPAYPGNLIWLKLISLIAVAGLAAACWRDFTMNRGLTPAQATLLVVITVLTPSLVFLATSTVMAECVFALVQVIGVTLVERTVRRDGQELRAPSVAGLAIGAAILIRTAGVALLVAALVYLASQRRWRQALVVAAVAAACALPWTLYVRAHAPSFEERLAHGGTIAFSYQQLLTMERLGNPEGGAASVGELAARGGRNIAGVFSRDLGAIVMPSIYRGPSESGQEVVSIGGPRGGSMGAAWPTMVASTILSLIVVAGWWFSRIERQAMPGLLCAATVAMVMPVGGQTFRYLVPLTPYLFLLLWRGLGGGRVARIALLCVLGFQLLDHAAYIRLKATATTEWIAEARDTNELFAWMAANVTGPGGVAATNPGLVYLATGRRTVSSGFPERNWTRWQGFGIRYVMSTLGGMPVPSTSLGGRLRYRSSRGGYWLVEM